jgi:preprotein translocase subunit SecD
MRSLFRGSLFAVACLSCVGPLAARPDEKKVTVEFRRAETKPTEGYTEATVEGTKEKVYIAKKADLTHADVAEAKADKDPRGDPAIELVLTKEGSKKLEALTGAQIGKPVAALIDGKVVFAPVVRAKVTGRAMITGKFTKEEVERIVTALNRK